MINLAQYCTLNYTNKFHVTTFRQIKSATKVVQKILHKGKSSDEPLNERVSKYVSGIEFGMFNWIVI